MEPLQEVEEGGGGGGGISLNAVPHIHNQGVELQQNQRNLHEGGGGGGGGEVVSVPTTPARNSPAKQTRGGGVSSTSGMAQTPGSTRPPSRTPRTPRTPWTPSSLLSPIGTPMKKAMINMKSYLEDVGHLTKLNPQDAWLPITESRSGNSYYAAFHTLNAVLGYQGLLLPVAFTFLGWTWGTIALTLAFMWQLYTSWILIRLHEAVPGIRYDRYVELAKAAFGNKLAKWVVLPSNINLTAGYATTLIIVGGIALKLFYKTVCGPDCGESPLSTIEWYLVFSMFSVVLAQLPNLNSIAGISIFGGITAIVYFTLLWTLSISRPRQPGTSYKVEEGESPVATTFSLLNALGLIAFAFRGHNLLLEIEATMPSTLKHPAHVPMWRGAKIANLISAMVFYPIALAGFWAYGSNYLLSSGILYSFYAFHTVDVSRALMAFTFLLVVFNCLSSFQIYSFTIYDSFEAGYTAKRNQPIKWYVRVAFRIFYVFTNFFIGVALPFLESLAGFLGGITSTPVTFAYPCLMWLAIKKPRRYSFDWYVNWTLGIAGLVAAIAITAGGVWSIVQEGLKLQFFKPGK